MIKTQFLEHEKGEESKILKSSRCKVHGSSESGDKFNLNAHCEGYTLHKAYEAHPNQNRSFLISFKRGKGGRYIYNPCSNFKLKNAFKKCYKMSKMKIVKHVYCSILLVNFFVRFRVDFGSIKTFIVCSLHVVMSNDHIRHANHLLKY